MEVGEENPKNPTIVSKGRADAKHYFVIKYKTKEEKESMSEKVLRLVKYHELNDFHIEEKPAYTETKVRYNYHTIVRGSDFTQEELEREFLKHN
ncbi:MAG: hypothetical protein KC589_00915 [Nanoarchaeota archaeon]|nr:hypothetical protein [Nanoarchaeota archaeon]